MAVIQDEQGNNKPIMTDTSHVFDVNGNPLHGQLVLGRTVAEDEVEPIDGYAHESDIASLMDLTFGTEVPVTTLFTTGGTYTVPSMGYVYGYFRKSANSTAGLIRITSNKMNNSNKYNQNLFTANEYVAVMLPVVRGEILTTYSAIEIVSSSSSLSFCPLVRRS